MSDDEGPPLDTPNGDAAVAAVKAHGDIVLDRTKTVHPCGCIITVVKYAHREMLDDVKSASPKTNATDAPTRGSCWVNAE
jgi:hypothetical protein